MIHWSAFVGAVFLGSSDMFEFLGGLKIAVVCMDSIHPAGNHHIIGQKVCPLNWLLFVISRAQMGHR